jgi:CO/xanthine dehydrogenase Mo-binding subunit
MSYIGTPTSRIDGHAKVTGAAKYAGEHNVDGLAYAAVVTSTIAKGRVARFDLSEALRVEGVLDILTHENRPPMARSTSAYKDDVAPEQGEPLRPLYDDKILFNRQPIALVLAEEWEIARFAASLVRVDYKPEPFATDLFAERGKTVTVEKPEKPRGKADKALAAAAVRHEAEYFIPIEHHNPMELYASTAVWEDGGKLTVYDKTQGVQNVQHYLCGIFNMKPDDVRVLSPYMGGGFGSGLRPQYQVVLAVLGAKALRRSVRLVLTRQQMYGLSYRPASIERLALGAKRDGTLEAVTHEAIAVTSSYEDFSRNDTGWSGLLYHIPYTSKKLRECYRQGAEAFGWHKRNPEPRSMRDGTELIGWGMASGVWEALQMPTAARIVLTANGHAEVACSFSDIGTGTYTIAAHRFRSTTSRSSSAIPRCRRRRWKAARGERHRSHMRSPRPRATCAKSFYAQPRRCRIRPWPPRSLRALRSSTASSSTPRTPAARCRSPM